MRKTVLLVTTAGILTAAASVWGMQQWLALRQQRLAIALDKLDTTRELLALDIEKSWGDLRVAWQAVQVSEKSIEQAEVNVREVTDRYEHGMVPFSDVLEAQALRQQAHDRRIDLTVEYWLKRSAYLRSVAAEAEAH